VWARNGDLGNESVLGIQSAAVNCRQLFSSILLAEVEKKS